MRMASIALILLLVASCSGLPPGSATAPLPQAGPTVAAEAVLSATASGLMLQASSFTFEHDQVSVQICFPLPSPHDWLIQEASLQVQGRVVPLYSSAPSDKFQNPVALGAPRCRIHVFPILLPPPPFTVVLTVDRIETSNPLVEPTCLGAQDALDSLATAVLLYCEETLGYPSFDISYNPQGLSLDEVQRMVHDAFYGVMEGPWIFEVNSQ